MAHDRAPQDELRFGTVGQPLPGVELRLADDGEVLVRGEIVMAGYRNQPEKTAETIDPEGWLHTGDIGSIDEDGYLRIVDRKKELIINAAGKNMSPANIEQQLKQGSPLIGQAMAIGDRRPYNVALIVLDPDACAAFAAQHGLADPRPRRCRIEPAGARGGRGRRRAGQPPPHPGRADQALQGSGRGLAPGGRRAHPDHEAASQLVADKYAQEIEELYER